MDAQQHINKIWLCPSVLFFLCCTHASINQRARYVLFLSEWMSRPQQLFSTLVNKCKNITHLFHGLLTFFFKLNSFLIQISARSLKIKNTGSDFLQVLLFKSSCKTWLMFLLANSAAARKWQIHSTKSHAASNITTIRWQIGFSEAVVIRV